MTAAHAAAVGPVPLGRRVYLGAVVVLATAMIGGVTAIRVARLRQWLGISLRTLARWRVWWREMFVASAFWRGARGRFMPPVMTETLPASLLEGLEAAWAFFDGVVRRLVVDNLAPAVTRPDRYTPGLNRVFLEYAQYRGFVVDPAVPEHPTGKPRVERGIPYARQDFFRGEPFLDVADMQRRAVGWCRALLGAAPARSNRRRSSASRGADRSARSEPRSPSSRARRCAAAPAARLGSTAPPAASCSERAAGRHATSDRADELRLLSAPRSASAAPAPKAAATARCRNRAPSPADPICAPTPSLHP